MKGCFLFAISARACGDQRAPWTLAIVFLSLIGNMIAHLAGEVKHFFHFFSCCQSLTISDLRGARGVAALSC